MKFPYKNFPRIGGKGYGQHAVIPVYIAMPDKNAPRSKKIEAFVDSGASRTTFHASIGEGLGFDVKKGEIVKALGANGKLSESYLHDMALYAPGGVIQIRAAFSYELPLAGILGMEGFFEHFTVTFDPVGKQIELQRILHT